MRSHTDRTLIKDPLTMALTTLIISSLMDITTVNHINTLITHHLHLITHQDRVVIIQLDMVAPLTIAVTMAMPLEICPIIAVRTVASALRSLFSCIYSIYSNIAF
jgi:hypothetical protein